MTLFVTKDQQKISVTTKKIQDITPITVPVQKFNPKPLKNSGFIDKSGS